jgi:outer membrane scaffolding protein for murein synthesis (MipA/OmpV family)
LRLAAALPFLIYRGEVLRIDRGGLDARLVHQKDFELDIGFSGSLPASSGDIAARTGMPDLGTLVEFGPRVKWALLRNGDGSRVQLELPVRTVLEIGGGFRGQGNVFEPAISYETRDAGADWRMSAKWSLVIADNQLGDYFYGVRQQYATASRPYYEAKAGLLLSRLTLDTARNLTPDMRVFGMLRYDSYAGAANASSPLMQQSSGVTLAVGFAWILGRSADRVSR